MSYRCFAWSRNVLKVQEWPMRQMASIAHLRTRIDEVSVECNIGV